MDTTPSPVVTLDGVSKTYQRRALYTDARVTIEPGRSHAIVGPNGSGKSVMMRMMCGLLRPDSGSVSVSYTHLTLPTKA